MKHLHRTIIALCMAFVLAYVPMWAQADVLERPAMQSKRAKSAVMLAITKAGNRIVSVGERGTILLSDDEGTTWRQASVPVSVSLTAVSFPTRQEGWVVGHSGIVLHSADAGVTWTKQLDGRQAAEIVLTAAKAVEGDAGQTRVTEAERLIVDGPDKPFLAVHFFDAKRGIVVGAYGLAFGTEDGGKTWTSLQSRIENPMGKHLYAITATNSEVLIAGEQGILLRSTGTSMRFSEVKTPYQGTYFGVVLPSPGKIVVLGLRGNAFWSGDNGASWEKIDTGTSNTLTAALKMADGRLVFADESGRVLISDDGGRNFKHSSVPSRSSITGVIQAADHFLLLSSVRGIVRLPILRN